MSGARTADISYLGFYGICNPTSWWLFQERPDLLSNTPDELRRPRDSRAPQCCQMRMLFRYDRGFASWYCTACKRHQTIGERRPRMEQPFEFDLEKELRFAIEGRMRELGWDEGECKLYDVRPRTTRADVGLEAGS